MSLATIPELVQEIQQGRMVIVVDDEDRENEGDFIMAAEAVTPAAIAFIVRHSSGIVCQPMTASRLAALDLPQMVAKNSESHRTAFTVSVDARKGTTTGVSAHDRAATIRALVDPDTRPEDLARPGHVFPLRYTEGGVLVRAGHTEATIDLVRLAGMRSLSGVLVEVVDDDGSMARRPRLEVFAREHGLKMGSIADLIAYRLATEHTVERVDERGIDTEFGKFHLVTYRDRIADDLHFALVHGRVDATVPTLVRVQVENPLADLLHWRRDDFGVAASDALRMIAAAESGVMLVLSAPRDKTSLLARLRAQPEQQLGRDPSQWRRNGAGAQILADLGLGKLRVIGTRRRQVGLAGFGLEVVEHVEPI